tara:strand:+ start:823 stop:1107 length:285 start_codon:yes stop_codon:yes gene_type:complete
VDAASYFIVGVGERSSSYSTSIGASFFSGYPKSTSPSPIILRASFYPSSLISLVAATVWWIYFLRFLSSFKFYLFSLSVFYFASAVNDAINSFI